MSWKKIIVFILASVFILLLAACDFSMLSPGEKTPTGPTLTPTTAIGPAQPSSKTGLADYQVQEYPICEIASFTGINTFDYQGNLDAWSPDGASFAFIQQTTKLTWFVGDLSIATGPKYDKIKVIAPDAAGRVYWSPDGKSLAFVALRIHDNVYTIMTVNSDGTGLIDLFPGKMANTDSYASKKTILSWPDYNRLRVMVSCGSGCTKSYEINPSDGTTSDYTPGDWENSHAWSMVLNEIEYDPNSYPVMNEPNWSTDKQYTTFLDEKYYMWMLENQKKTIHLVYLDDLFPVYSTQPWARETHWSPQDLLAVRVDDHIGIFDPTCAKPIVR
jgi:hypothetical protein